MLIRAKEVRLKDGVQVVLRSPEPREAATMLLHLRTVFHESYRNMNFPAEHFDAFSETQEAEILERFSQASNQFMLSVFKDQRIIGNLGCFGELAPFAKHSARIGMGIEKAYCGLGLGTELLKCAIEQARAIQFHRLELSVRTFNVAGIKLYERCGFERVGILKDAAHFDGKYHDEYLYQLLLNDKS